MYFNKLKLSSSTRSFVDLKKCKMAASTVYDKSGSSLESSSEVKLADKPEWIIVSRMNEKQEEGLVRLLNDTKSRNNQKVAAKAIMGRYSKFDNESDISNNYPIERMVNDFKQFGLEDMIPNAECGLYAHDFILCDGDSWEERHNRQRNKDHSDDLPEKVGNLKIDSENIDDDDTYYLSVAKNVLLKIVDHAKDQILELSSNRTKTKGRGLIMARFDSVADAAKGNPTALNFLVRKEVVQMFEGNEQTSKKLQESIDTYIPDNEFVFLITIDNNTTTTTDSIGGNKEEIFTVYSSTIRLKSNEK